MNDERLEHAYEVLGKKEGKEEERARVLVFLRSLQDTWTKAVSMGACPETASVSSRHIGYIIRCIERGDHDGQIT